VQGKLYSHPDSRQKVLGSVNILPIWLMLAPETFLYVKLINSKELTV